MVQKRDQGIEQLAELLHHYRGKFVSRVDILEWLDMPWGTWDPNLSNKETGIYQLSFFLKGDAMGILRPTLVLMPVASPAGC